MFHKIYGILLLHKYNQMQQEKIKAARVKRLHVQYVCFCQYLCPCMFVRCGQTLSCLSEISFKCLDPITDCRSWTQVNRFQISTKECRNTLIHSQKHTQTDHSNCKLVSKSQIFKILFQLTVPNFEQKNQRIRKRSFLLLFCGSVD